MKKLLYLLFILSLSLSGCSSDEKEDEHITALKKELAFINAEIEKVEIKITEQEKYCSKFPEGTELNECRETWIVPLEKILNNYKERKEKIEKELGMI